MRRWSVPLLAATVLGGPAWAQESDTLVVTGNRLPEESEQLEGVEAGAGAVTNLGEAIENLPGVSVVRRAAGATDPVIRGIGGEHVQTQVGAVPVFGGCPSHMDPPVTYLPPHAVQEATVVMGVPSVAYGGGGIGGRIIVTPDYRRPVGAPDEIHGFLGQALDAARRGYRAEAGVYGGLDWVDVRATAGAAQMSDYPSGGGLDVPAEQNEVSGTLSAGFRPFDRHRFWSHFSYFTEWDVDIPALPMDIDDSSLAMYNAGYEIGFADDVLKKLEVQAGFSLVDHLMSNRNKSNRAMLQAETPTDTTTVGASASVKLRPGLGTTLQTGADFWLLERDATRTRHMGGKTFEDRIWPEISQTDAGLFAELTLPLPGDLILEAGGRADVAVSSANAVDSTSVGGKTVAEQYVSFYGDGASEVDRTEPLGSGRLLLKWAPPGSVQAHVGGGLTSAAAGTSERYYAFAPAPGGAFLIGNPDLAPEKKWETEVGLAVRHAYADASISGFAFWIRDYVLRRQIAQRDVNGDGKEDIIRGFQNRSARLVGGDLKLAIRPVSHVTVPLTVSYVRGDNTTEDVPLPEIPPLEGTAALRVHGGAPLQWWAEAGTRFAASQDRVDAAFPENTTPSHYTLQARVGLALPRTFRLEIGADNLLDADYHEHLTREAALDVGDLKAGDEIPAPGRRFYFMLRGEI